MSQEFLAVKSHILRRPQYRGLAVVLKCFHGNEMWGQLGGGVRTRYRLAAKIFRGFHPCFRPKPLSPYISLLRIESCLQTDEVFIDLIRHFRLISIAVPISFFLRGCPDISILGTVSEPVFRFPGIPEKR